MTGRLLSITRFAVKGLTGEALEEALLEAGRGLKDDRRYALALPGTVFDPAHPVPLPKTRFAVWARFARMAALKSRYVPATTMLTLEVPGGPAVTARLDRPEDYARIERAVEEIIGAEIDGRVRLIDGRSHRFTDVSVVSPEMMEAVSLINLSSLEAFAAHLGRPIDPRRFRGNLLIDGIPPFAELDWVGRTIEIGGVRFKGALRTQRCAATEVDPDRAVRDIRLPLELRRAYRHADMGIYLYVETEGVIQPGDPVRMAA